MLSPDDVVCGERVGRVRITGRLGGGGQGEVYRAETATGAPLAIKWYKPNWATREQARVLDHLISRGSPDPRFLWPICQVTLPEPAPGAASSFGYAMPLCEPEYVPLVRLVNGTLDPALEPGFAELLRICQHIVESFRLLHLSGLCYRDVSLANLFFHPATAGVRICDVDNVGIDDGSSKVLGTPLFMAPEIVRDTAATTFPSRGTDLHSLAVVLFYLLFLEHPLVGAKVDSGIWNEEHAVEHFGRNPVFVLSPTDSSNRPVSPHVERYWALYPRFLRERVLTAFGEGLHNPAGRVTEGEWLRALSRLRDAMGACPECAATVFFDLDAPSETTCHGCGCRLPTPLVLRIGNRRLVVSRHLRFGSEVVSALPVPGPPIAEAVAHPSAGSRIGLKNETEVSWNVRMPDGSEHTVGPRQAVELTEGTTIQLPALTATVTRG
jgi:DNA-binding helix-hairpin-helix protein with protein kinase domain